MSKIYGNTRPNRKADFTLSFSTEPSPGFKDLYDRLEAAENSIVSHLNDAVTRTTALFSCIEVKAVDGDQSEARCQLCIWMAASLRKKRQLAQSAGLEDMRGLVEPCFVIFGHQLQLHFAYMEEGTDKVHIVGPMMRPFQLCETSTLTGTFQALRLWRNVIRYGRDEGSEGFWGGFMGVVLEKLAGDTDEEHSAALASAAQTLDEGEESSDELAGNIHEEHRAARASVAQPSNEGDDSSDELARDIGQGHRAARASETPTSDEGEGNGERSSKKARKKDRQKARRRCGICRETGHDKRNCRKKGARS